MPYNSPEAPHYVEYLTDEKLKEVRDALNRQDKEQIAHLLGQVNATHDNDLRLRLVMSAVSVEAIRSFRIHGRHNSPHESWGILMEELDEAIDELRANDKAKFNAEMLQIASVCLRAIIDRT